MRFLFLFLFLFDLRVLGLVLCEATLEREMYVGRGCLRSELFYRTIFCCRFSSRCVITKGPAGRWRFVARERELSGQTCMPTHPGASERRGRAWARVVVCDECFRRALRFLSPSSSRSTRTDAPFLLVSLSTYLTQETRTILINYESGSRQCCSAYLICFGLLPCMVWRHMTIDDVYFACLQCTAVWCMQILEVRDT